MKKWILSAMLTLAFAPGAAFGSLLIEPGLAYRTGNYSGGSGVGGKVTGVGLTARAAYEFPVVFAGLDLSYNFGTSTPDTGPSGDTTAVMVGPVVGASLPMLPLRFWAAYLLWNYTTVKSGSAYDNVNSGSAIKIGGGYMIIPMVSINLDYTMHTYTKQENKLTGQTADLSPNITGSDIMISASIPLSL